MLNKSFITRMIIIILICIISMPEYAMSYGFIGLMTHGKMKIIKHAFYSQTNPNENNNN